MDGIISRTIELSQVLANTLIQGNLREISIRSVIALLKICSRLLMAPAPVPMRQSLKCKAMRVSMCQASTAQPVPQSNKKFILMIRNTTASPSIDIDLAQVCTTLLKQKT